MDDRLVWLLQRFELRARVFQAGPLCRSYAYDAEDGLGYLHVLKQGRLQVLSASHPPLLLAEPTLFLYMNPTSHRLVPRDQTVEMVCASFEFGAGLRNPLMQALPNIVTVRLQELPALELTLRLLFQEAAEQHCGRQAVLDRLSEVVIVQVLRNLMDEQRLESGLLAGLADPRLAKAINAMHAEPARHWSLDALASIAGMSRARFATRFRDIVGMTPVAYLTEWRIGVAQSLLRKGKPVQLVADAVGYGNASALSRAFRAQVGQSPVAWAKQSVAER